MAEPENAAPVAEAPPAEAPAEPKPLKKTKKKKGHSKLLMLMLLVAGAAAGLQMSGTYDLRPTVYHIVPRIPWVGEKLAQMLNVPAIYSLSAEERRRVELDEWEQSIAKRKRALDDQDKAMIALSSDLSAKRVELDRAIAQVQAQLEESNDESRSRRTSSNGGGDEVASLITTFGEMSPKSAAAIVEKMDPTLAVAVLDGLDDNFRARVLGKIEAGLAATLMERLTELQNSRQ